MNPPGHRVESLDVFRGLTIASMILVNNPGDWSAVYEPLLHAYWNGCTFADVVFPTFIFIVGVAATFAFSRRRDAGMSHLLWRIARRAALLIALGLILNITSPPNDTGTLRFPGVLQRIALVYCATAAFVLTTSWRGRMVAIVGLLAVHTFCLLHVPFGGHPAGTMTADASFAGYVDRLLLGRHVMHWGYDPEGLFGTLSATATALLGTLAGRWLRTTPGPARRFAGLFVGGVVMIAAGLVLARVIPLNKNLWTASYAVFTAGIACTVLAICYLVVDMWRVRGWERPFVWLGVNPLAIYFLAELVGHFRDRPVMIAGELTTAQSWMFWNVFEPVLSHVIDETAVISLIVGLLTVTLWTLLAWALHRKNVRIVV